MTEIRLLEHTADIGIEVRAANLPELFRGAAEGLMRVLAPEVPARPVRSRPVELTAGDRSELLVNWLNEILYWLESGRLLPAAFSVQTVDETRLRAVIHGEDLDRPRHRPSREVKAATWHQLELGPCGAGWQCRVYLDL